jgi:hypothetical protein
VQDIRTLRGALVRLMEGPRGNPRRRPVPGQAAEPPAGQD